eukprot:372594-Pelagomonas_calceolata.AAC.1
MASPLNYNTQCHQYWSSDPRGIEFGPHYNSLSSRFSGMSICHPIYDKKALLSQCHEASITACYLLGSPKHRVYSHLHASASKWQAHDNQPLLKTPQCLPTPLLQAWDRSKKQTYL